MISATNIRVQYGERILLDNISIVIGERDKLGLVGRNGAGKSTLLKILAGSLIPETGSVDRPNDSTIGYLHQEIEIPKGKTVLEESLTAFKEARKIQKRLEVINRELAERTDYESEGYFQLLNELAEKNDRFQILGGYSMEADAEKVLKGLGFALTDFSRKTEEFSGGWQMRIELAKILLRRPSFLLLDEPNNHLDIEAIIWLEQFLKDYEGAVIIISHDKMFLDNITTRTVEIEFGDLFDYKGNYSKYIELRLLRREKLEAEFKNQQAKIAQTEKLIDRFRAKASKAKFAQSLIKQLDRMDRIELEDENNSAMRIKFPPAPRSGEVVFQVHKLVKKYGDLSVLSGLELQIVRGDRIALVGQNGQGKTTLSRILVGDLEKTSGKVEIGHNVKIGYYAQNQAEILDQELTLLETMELASPPEMRTRLRSILGSFLFSGEDVDKKVSVLSGGERARLALACLLLKPHNLLVLDEPTNHLDIPSKDILKKALQQFEGTLIIVSHDRDFLHELTDKTIEFREKKIFEYLGDVSNYLEKRNLNNLREAGLSTSVKTTNGSSNNTYANQKERDKDKRRLEKDLKACERKIETVEKEIADFEKKMSQPGFYEEAGANDLIKKYQQAKADLEKAMEEWEVAQSEMDKFLA